METTNETEVQTQSVDAEITEAMTQIQEPNGNKVHMTNKRIDFDKRTMKRLNTIWMNYKKNRAHKFLHRI